MGKKHTTLAEFLPEWERSSRGLRANTTAGYAKVVTSRIRPTFGDVQLRKIDQRRVQEWVNALADEGLSGRTVEYYFTVLAVILRMAAEYGLCAPIQKRTRTRQGVRLPRGHLAGRAMTARPGDRLSIILRFGAASGAWIAAGSSGVEHPPGLARARGAARRGGVRRFDPAPAVLILGAGR